MEMVTNFTKSNIFKILFLSIPIVIWFVNYNSSDNDFSFCVFKNIFGIKCYGCGFTRGLSAFLHLKFQKMYELNKLNIITIPLLAYLYFKQVVVFFNKKKITNNLF
jgi:hypothetical protein